MKDLDNKLRGIKIHPNKIVFPDHDNPLPAYAFLDDEAIAQIKQAFAEYGYHTRTYKAGPNGLPVMEQELMTGREWFELFEKVLSDEIYGDTNPTDKVDCEAVPYLCTCDLLKAARRAAGIGDSDDK
jgi:hypothetical protein